MLFEKLTGACFIQIELETILLFNNYSPKARWLSVNKNRDEVE
jgi:hypothetical protein